MPPTATESPSLAERYRRYETERNEFVKHVLDEYYDGAEITVPEFVEMDENDVEKEFFQHFNVIDFDGAAIALASYYSDAHDVDVEFVCELTRSDDGLVLAETSARENPTVFVSVRPGDGRLPADAGTGKMGDLA